MRTGGPALKRRNFLAAAAAGAAGCARSRKTGAAFRFFSEDEARTIDAWAECLIPADRDPGARAAGVVSYIDRQLTLKYKRYQKDYREAIATLNALARKQHGREFAALDFAAQTELLKAFEAGENREAFNMVLNHTMQGFYGNPRHGGNRDYASWRMIGVPTVPVRGRLHYTLTEKI